MIGHTTGACPKKLTEPNEPLSPSRCVGEDAPVQQTMLGTIAEGTPDGTGSVYGSWIHVQRKPSRVAQTRQGNLGENPAKSTILFMDRDLGADARPQLMEGVEAPGEGDGVGQVVTIDPPDKPPDFNPKLIHQEGVTDQGQDEEMVPHTQEEESRDTPAGDTNTTPV
ncbi:hypothetical protein K2173_028120 [Erythroxylum novogranatense]|uniref:Uncharacterized protein n=1 Tax=Erythroxylum novogranatense TaxID=1862640 RepID=A0AAV8U3L8_9ROSI|nr:hypothetical protein K2173_028120 [Erythroxylum novogranatense]